jgi:hypothetical protein
MELDIKINLRDKVDTLIYIERMCAYIFSLEGVFLWVATSSNSQPSKMNKKWLDEQNSSIVSNLMYHENIRHLGST